MILPSKSDRLVNPDDGKIEDKCDLLYCPTFACYECD